MDVCNAALAFTLLNLSLKFSYNIQIGIAIVNAGNVKAGIVRDRQGQIVIEI